MEKMITTTIENKITTVIEDASKIFENRIHTMMQQLLNRNNQDNEEEEESKRKNNNRTQQYETPPNKKGKNSDATPMDVTPTQQE